MPLWPKSMDEHVVPEVGIGRCVSQDVLHEVGVFAADEGLASTEPDGYLRVVSKVLADAG